MVSARSSTSVAMSSLLTAKAERPICCAPASTPVVMSCVWLVVSYRSCIVNGSSRVIFAFPHFSMRRILPCRSAGMGVAPSVSKHKPSSVSASGVDCPYQCSAGFTHTSRFLPSGRITYKSCAAEPPGRDKASYGACLLPLRTCSVQSQSC